MTGKTESTTLALHRIQEVSGLPEVKLNELPFGAIRLDKEGKILSFNKYEAKLTVRDANNVIGKNFFVEVAPCTNVKAFAGRYREGVRKGELHAVFPYTCDFKMAPRDVRHNFACRHLVGSDRNA